MWLYPQLDWAECRNQCPAPCPDPFHPEPPCSDTPWKESCRPEPCRHDHHDGCRPEPCRHDHQDGCRPEPCHRDHQDGCRPDPCHREPCCTDRCRPDPCRCKPSCWPEICRSDPGHRGPCCKPLHRPDLCPPPCPPLCPPPCTPCSNPCLIPCPPGFHACPNPRCRPVCDMDWSGAEACVLCEDCDGNQIVLIRRQRFCVANGECVKCRRFT